MQDTAALARPDRRARRAIPWELCCEDPSRNRTQHGSSTNSLHNRPRNITHRMWLTTYDAGNPPVRFDMAGAGDRVMERVYASGMKLFLALGLLLVISGAVTGGGCSKTGTGFSTDAATSSDSASATGGIFADGGSGRGDTAGLHMPQRQALPSRCLQC
jgi:hypothetical protein